MSFEDRVLDCFFENLNSSPVMGREERMDYLRALRIYLDEAESQLFQVLVREKKSKSQKYPITTIVRERLSEKFRNLPPERMAKKAVESKWAPVYLREWVSPDAEKLFWLLVESNIRFVVTVVHRQKWMLKHLPETDLIQVGTLGLAEGLARFDPSRGLQLTSYVKFWIEQSLGREVQKTRRGYRLSYGLSEIMSSVSRAQNSFYRMHGRYMTNPELSKELNVSEERLNDAVGHYEFALSLEAESEDSLSLQDSFRVEPHFIEEVRHRIDHERLVKVIDDAIKSSLTRREQDILRLSEGLQGMEPISRKEIAEKYGVSRTRIGQIHRVAKTKLGTALKLCFKKNHGLMELVT